MTNEEIEQFASDLYQLALDGDYFGVEDKGAAKLREILVRAYEEAAQIAANHPENVSVGCGGGAECSDHIAADIRALKASLVPVESAST